MKDGFNVTWPSGGVSLWLDFDLIGNNPAFPGVTQTPGWVFDRSCLYSWGVNNGFTISNVQALPGKKYSGMNTATAGTNQNGCFVNGSTIRNNSIQYPGTTQSWQVMSYGTNFANRPFSMEFWAYITAYPTSGNTYYLVAQSLETGTPGWRCYITSTGAFVFSCHGSDLVLYTASGSTVPLNQWNHFAIERKDDTIYTFVNGVASSSVVLPAAIALADGTSNPLVSIMTSIGDVSTTRTTGWIDQVLITQGFARFPVAGFTPAVPYPLISTPFGGNVTPIGSLATQAPVSGLIWTVAQGPAASNWNLLTNSIGSYAIWTTSINNMATVYAGSGVQLENIMHYFEIVVTGTATGSGVAIGIVDPSNAAFTSWLGQDTHGLAFYYPTPQFYANSSVISGTYPASWGTTGDNLGVAMKWDSVNSQLRVWLRRNGGAWGGGGDPAANTTPSAIINGSFLASGVFQVAGHIQYANETSPSYTMRVLQSAAYTIPSGFSYWV